MKPNPPSNFARRERHFINVCRRQLFTYRDKVIATAARRTAFAQAIRIARKADETVMAWEGNKSGCEIAEDIRAHYRRGPHG